MFLGEAGLYEAGRMHGGGGAGKPCAMAAVSLDNVDRVIIIS